LLADDKDKFEKVISQNIQDRITDGQFDECKITMEDLKIIKDTCIANMAGVSHKRVEYKEIPKSNKNNK
ncbi:MAG: hypothetical protein PF588_10135, partial [Candidatus Kapabacteria bacterium]|nr:hypothetical protein [Candidatus Kapabacteria bacterium]